MRIPRQEGPALVGWREGEMQLVHYRARVAAHDEANMVYEIDGVFDAVDLRVGPVNPAIVRVIPSGAPVGRPPRR